MSSASDKKAWVREEFNQIAVDGMLGDPKGQPAMAYLRVSSSGQAEEGRSGFPRQLLHIDEKARSLHLAIPWELVFFDDHTGFEFRDRPSLTKLRELVRLPERPANDLVIENLDRLSREATWHQGFLLDELEHSYNIRVYFWKELGSTLERAIYGTITQDRMRTDLERMAMGNVHKARSGRVTARKPAYGYKLVDSQGGTENAKKDTNYTPYEPEAEIVRLMYHLFVKERLNLSDICRHLIQKGVKPPKSSCVWESSLITVLLKNEVYKGEFYAHRYTYVCAISKRTGKEIKKKIERHPSEWIKVPVPPLVPLALWEDAQKILCENKEKSKRGSKHEYLLLGLTHCAYCNGLRMTSGITRTQKQNRSGLTKYHFTHYRCLYRASLKYIREQRGYTYCPMPQISARRLDKLVWDVVVSVLFDPERLASGMDRYFSRQNIETTRDEIAFIQGQITQLEIEDEMLYRAYLVQAFDVDEFAQKRFDLREKKQRLVENKVDLEHRFSELNDVEQQKQQILSLVEELKGQASEDIPFELKRRIILKVVSKVTVNTQEQWFVLEGAITGRFDFNPAGGV